MAGKAQGPPGVAGCEQHGACVASKPMAAHPGPRSPWHCIVCTVSCVPVPSGLCIRIFSSPIACVGVRGVGSPALRTSTAGASAVLGVSAGGSPPAGVQALTIHWSGRLCTKIPLENVTCIFQLKTIILQYVFPKIKVFWGEKRRLRKDGDTVRNGRVEGCGLMQAPGQSQGEGGHGALAHVWLDGRVLVTGPVTVPVSGSLGRVPSLGFVRSKWLGFSQSRHSVPEERRPLAVLQHRTRSRWALIAPAD